MKIDIIYISNATLGSRIFADVVIENKKVSSYSVRIPRAIKRAEVKKFAESVMKFIETNIRKGIKYTGGKVAPLKPATIEAKKRKGRAEPSRVFVDSGQLIKGLKLVTLGAGYSVGFKPYTYPDTNMKMDEVATYLNEGTKKMVARPFFGLTQKKFNELIDKAIGKERVTPNIKRAAEITRQLIEIRRRTGNVLSVRQVNNRRPRRPALVREEND